jgi:hypothetical protein
MPNLLNLGTALGGFTQGYQNAENQRLQNQIRQLALSQALSQQRSQRLAAQYLQSGGFGNLLNTNTLPGGMPLPLPGGPTPPPPPMPGQPSIAAQPPQTAAAPTEPPVDPSEATFTPPEPTGPDASTGYTASVPGEWKEEYTTPQPSAASMAPAQRPGPQTASTGASDAQQAPAPSGGGAGGGDAPPFPMLAQMFQRVDYGKLAQGIARIAPPGTDQADIYQAVIDLAKLAQGDKTEQIQAALIGKELGLLNARDIANMRDQTAQLGIRTRAATAAAGQAAQTGRTELQVGSREKIAAANLQFRTLAEQRRYDQRAQQLQLAAQREGRGQQALQIQRLRAQIATIKPADGVTYSDEQQKQLAQINARIEALGTQPATQ